MIDQTLIKGTESKSQLDRLMQSESRVATIIRTRDPIIDITEPEWQRNFIYKYIGVTYKPFIKNPSNYTIDIRFEYEPIELKLLKADSSAIYRGMLVIGNQFFNTELSLEKILKNPGFSFIKKGEITAGKRIMPYALVSFENILIKLFINPINGHLKMVELLK